MHRIERSQSPRSFADRVDEAVAAIRKYWQGTARVALILGTGMGNFADNILVEKSIPYSLIPHFPRSTALSHRGRLVAGTVAGTPTITMDGRCHLYEGYSIDDLTLPIHVMRRLGADLLVASNASGGVNPKFAMGDIMAMEDHINLMWRALGASETNDPWSGSGGVSLDRASACVYDPRLIDGALAVARRENFTAHRGVYVAVSGPNYETRAEYRAFRRLGGDVVGMSTVPETLTASKLGMRVMALSIVTNVAKPDALTETSAEEVVAAAQRSEPNLRKIVMETIARQ